MLKFRDRSSSPPLWRNGFRPGLTHIRPISPIPRKPLDHLRNLLATAPPPPPKIIPPEEPNESRATSFIPSIQNPPIKLSNRQKRNKKNQTRKQAELTKSALEINITIKAPSKNTKPNKLQVARQKYGDEINLLKRHVLSKDNHIHHLKRIIKHQANLLKQKDEYINAHIRSFFPYPRDLKPRPHPIKRMYIPEPFILATTSPKENQESEMPLLKRPTFKTTHEYVDVIPHIHLSPPEEMQKEINNASSSIPISIDFPLSNNEVQFIQEEKGVGDDILAIEIKAEPTQQSHSQLLESERHLYNQYRLNYPELVKQAIARGDTELDNNPECIPTPMTFHEFAHLNPDKDEARGEIGDFVYRPHQTRQPRMDLKIKKERFN